ncbi:MAG: class 1 fructose-bisphosphatase [Octadecabacter sp.]
MQPSTLSEYLARNAGEAALADLIERIASACWFISDLVNASALAGHQGSTDEINPQGEVQKPLDILADEVFVRSCSANTNLSALISEEVEEITWVNPAQTGAYVLAYDPLDGFSNLDVDLSVGSIFAVSKLRSDSAEDVLPNGRDLKCSGYAIYGPSTMLVLTFGERVDGFTLDKNTDSFVLTHPHMTVPPHAIEFAINVSRQRHWDETIQSYISDCLQGPDGPRQKSFNMRWTASMVADVHRILIRGGVFLYPVDADNHLAGGKLRLLYEAMPMAMIVEAAGGGATDGYVPLLDVAAATPHQRTSVILGAREETDLIRAAYS